jgi:cobyrinic acid a,c-diamide synthase
MNHLPRAPGLVVSAPRSGAGKTTVTLGILRALKARGRIVQPFKCGPDYIDPGLHAAAAGRPSFNIDTWAMRRELIAGLVASASSGAEICIAEGVMGLFDGVASSGASGRGATADVAALLGWPVVLVLDVSGQTETAAAIALGMGAYRKDIRIAGVILNRVASARHEALIVPSLERMGFPVLGSLPRRDELQLPERHLGLVQAEETADLDGRLDHLAAGIASAVRLDDLVAAAAPGNLVSDGPAPASPLGLQPPGQRIALARDAAFSFTYPHVVEGWRSAGAEILPFSPLADEEPDVNADVVWLPGGYPELHAATVAAARIFRDGMHRAARSVPVHGECGGYMVLGQGLEDASGARHAMLGLLGLETSFAKRRLHLGYRRAQLLVETPLGPAGASVLGHEFHYASVIAASDDPLVACQDANGDAVAERGSRRGHVTGTFFHVIDWMA